MAEHLVEWFWELSAARAQGFNGPCALSLTDIANWSQLTGEIVTREEVAILRQMDAAYLSACAEERRASEERGKANNG
ncbi:hypothetical protein ACLBXM_20080 [Xanthobacteraceae bacterium A53D]